MLLMVAHFQLTNGWKKNIGKYMTDLCFFDRSEGKQAKTSGHYINLETLYSILIIVKRSEALCSSMRVVRSDVTTGFGVWEAV